MKIITTNNKRAVKRIETLTIAILISASLFTTSCEEGCNSIEEAELTLEQFEPTSRLLGAKGWIIYQMAFLITNIAEDICQATKGVVTQTIYYKAKSGDEFQKIEEFDASFTLAPTKSAGVNSKYSFLANGYYRVDTKINDDNSKVLLSSTKGKEKMVESITALTYDLNGSQLLVIKDTLYVD